MNLQIEKLVYGGDGLTHDEDGQVLFVPWSAPGDLITAAPLAGNRKPTRAQIETLIQPSIDRVAPPCPVFGVCGGCQWQHIRPEAQREWKRHIVEESMQRLGGFYNIAVHPTWGSDELSWGYRNRVQWDLTVQDDDITLGYSKAQSHDGITFTHCEIISEEMNQIYQDLLQLLRNEPFYSNPPLLKAIRRIELMQNAAGECLLSIQGPDPAILQEALSKNKDFVQSEPLLHQLRNREDLKGLVYLQDLPIQKIQQGFQKGTILWGQGALIHELGGYQYRVSAGSFFQTSNAAAEFMIQHARDWLPEKTDSLLDLYAGVGTFAIALHEKVKQVVAIECASMSLEDAKSNIRFNQAGNIMLHAGQVETVLRSLNQDFQAAILDPPRNGSTPNTLHWLARHVTHRILYISCNPTTLARDLKLLVGLGWKIDSVQPLDMFPQTYHIETMVQLSRQA